MIDKKRFCVIIKALLDQYDMERDMAAVGRKYNIESPVSLLISDSYMRAMDELIDFVMGSQHAELVYEFVYAGEGSLQVEIMEENVILDTPELLYDYIGEQ